MVGHGVKTQHWGPGGGKCLAFWSVGSYRPALWHLMFRGVESFSCSHALISHALMLSGLL